MRTRILMPAIVILAAAAFGCRSRGESEALAADTPQAPQGAHGQNNMTVNSQLPLKKIQDLAQGAVNTFYAANGGGRQVHISNVEITSISMVPETRPNGFVVYKAVLSLGVPTDFI